MRFNMKPGIPFAIAYVFLMSLSVVWIDELQSAFHQSFMLLFVSLSAVIFYNLISFRSLKPAYASIIKAPLQWLLMSGSFAMTWWLVYYSTIHASSRATMVIFYLLLATLGCFFEKKYSHTIICIAATFISILLLPELDTITILTSIGCGLLGYIYMKTSRVYAVQHNLNAHQILSIRFYLLLLFSLGFIYYQLHYEHIHQIIPVKENIYPNIFALSLLVVFNLAPNYCVQKCICIIGESTFSQIVTLTPTFTFILQGIFQQHWDVNVLILCLAISLLLNLVVKSK